MIARASKFADRLPRTFPGCWKDARWRKEYRAAWMAQKRGTDAEYYAKELRAQRGGTLPMARPALAAPIRTRMGNVEIQRREALADGKCFFCMERRATEIVERRRRTANREVVALRIPYCGRC
jgi:hypothetical protein